MRLSAIVAAAKNGVIGKNGRLPWHLPSELARFREITTGHPIIMGRATHEESIGRVLPGRTNIIVTHDKKHRKKGCIIANSLEEAIKVAKKSPGAEEIFIIGGQSIFEQIMPKLDRIYLTKIEVKVDGDRFFDYEPSEWRVLSHEQHKADGKNQYGFEFQLLERL